jgi:ribonuclease HI
MPAPPRHSRSRRRRTRTSDPPRQAVIVAYIDGGSRGNPGPAGYGVRVEDDRGELVDELRGFIGVSTNNTAEYQGLLAALQYAASHGHRAVRIRSDSELLVKQMRGEYRVKNPRLQVLHQSARLLVDQLERVVFEHVRRECNVEADRLVNAAIDEATSEHHRPD